jgi:hypothetical protein
MIKIIAELKNDLEITLDKLGDAEDGAILLLNQNTELYSRNRQLAQLTAQIRKEAAGMERKAIIQPYVIIGHGIGFSLGGTLMGMGIVKNNISQTLLGGGVILGTGAIYLIGNKIFKWW